MGVGVARELVSFVKRQAPMLIRYFAIYNKLGVMVLRVEFRQMFRSNGLIDDFVVYGSPADYETLSEHVQAAISSSGPIVLSTDSAIRIEISKNDQMEQLFTSLQNEDNEYFSMQDWDARSILRVVGPAAVLQQFAEFLADVSGRGEGYSYISEFSASNQYSCSSPEWRLHVQSTSHLSQPGRAKARRLPPTLAVGPRYSSP